MMSQKVSPGALWVTMATLIRGVFAWPPEIEFAFSSASLPPESLHAAAASTSPTAATTVTILFFLSPNMCSPSRLCRLYWEVGTW